MQIGLTLSLLVHAAAFWIMSGGQRPPQEQRLPLKEIEVSYYRRAEQPQPSAPVNVAAVRPSAPPAPAVAGPMRPAPMASAVLEPPAAASAAAQKQQMPDTIDLSNLTQLSKNAVAYVDYFRLLRERIRQSAMRRYPSRSAQGEVFLTFTVTADGRVINAHLVDAKSTPDPMLRAASLESLRDAAPFPPFPKTLNRPQMTFHIIIAYELEQ